MPSIPIILCGKREEIGAPVIEQLKPEYDVVHFVMSVESAIEELPHVLKGSEPPQRGSKLGSSDYGSTPRAVVFGGGYDDTAAGAIINGTGGLSIPVLRADPSVPMPPVGPEYGKRILDRCKTKLDELAKDGKLDGNHRGVFQY